MSQTSKLETSNLTFTTSSATTGSISYSNADDEFQINRPSTFTQGVYATNVTVSSSGGVIATSNYGDIDVDTLTVKTQLELEDDQGTPAKITLEAPSSVTAHTLKFPSAQGGSLTGLLNDGSGNLSWVPVSTLVYAIQGGYFDVTFSAGDFNLSNLASTNESKYDVDLVEKDTYSMRSGTTFTVPSSLGDGWYNICFSVFHPGTNFGSSGTQEGLGDFRVAIVYNSNSNAEYGDVDAASGTPEFSQVNQHVYLTSGETFKFYMQCNTQTNEDAIVRAAIMKM